MNSSDSVEQTVRLTLEGMEVAFKIAGAGAKNIAVMIYTMMKDKEKTKGKTRLTNMLKTGKPLKIFTFKAEDLKVFSREAEKYGVLYCALAIKKDSKIDGEVDIMIREEDAPKVNRIAERFEFKEIATIKKELEQEKQTVKEEPKDEIKKLIDDIMPEENDQPKEFPSNTNHTEEKNLLEISSDTKICNKIENSEKNEKKSVIEELKEIEKELKNQEKQEDLKTIREPLESDKQKEERQSKNKGRHRKQPKHLKETKKGRGKRVKVERSK